MVRPHRSEHRHGHRAAHGAHAEPAQREGHHGRGRRRLRPFGNGDLRLILLAAIAQAPSHGYELIRAIEDRLGGSYSPSPGIVYPTLTLLEELGYLAASVDGAKKLYSLTEAGRSHLQEQQAALAQVNARMAAFGQAQEFDRLAPVTRAMENLKLAIRMRTGARLSDAQIAAIRDVLDAGATAIEQV